MSLDKSRQKPHDDPELDLNMRFLASLSEYAPTQFGSMMFRIGSNPATPLKVIERLFELKNINFCRGYSERDDADPEILDSLSHYDDILLKSAIAKNPRTRMDTLERLNGDASETIVNATLLNPHVTVQMIHSAYKRYSRIKSGRVMRTIHQHPLTPAPIREELEFDQDS